MTIQKHLSKAFDILSQCLRLERPVCQVCIMRPSTAVHHIVHRSQSLYLYLDETNLLVCCSSCERKFHGQTRYARVFNDIERIEILERVISTEGIEYLKRYKHHIRNWTHAEIDDEMKTFRQRLKEDRRLL